MLLPKPLKPDQLFTACDPDTLDLSYTGGSPDGFYSIGQKRAMDAIRFGVGIKRAGYNIFAHGAPGTGKRSLVRQYLDEAATKMPIPPDWCYVHNFEEAHKPKALSLPAGKGCALRNDMEKLIEELRVAIPAAFESEEYQGRVQALNAGFEELHEKSFADLQAKAKEKNIALIRTPSGLALAPMSKGEVVTPEAFRQWPDELQEKIKEDINTLEKALQENLQKLTHLERDRREQHRELNQEVTGHAVGGLIADMSKKYGDMPAVLTYIEQVRKDLLENAEDFQTTEPSTPQDMMMLAMRGRQREPSFRRYEVNVIIDHGDQVGAPVVYEDLPTHGNIIGRIEQMAQFGTLVTDFNLIKPGALHRANGGFLIIDARKIFIQPIIWEEIKRALSAGEIRIQGLTEAFGFANTVTLQPEPIRLDVKIVLLGDPMLFYLLNQADPEFPELFKVAADFDDRVPNNDENLQSYVRLVQTIAERETLRPLKPSAIARVIEQASRLADDSERLTLRMRQIVDLLYESDYWAGDMGAKKIAADHVQRAIDAQTHRADRIRERSQEQIIRETMLIDTDGAVVGQVNGLSVLQLGDFSFGKPTRITAQVRVGRGEVVDIEREIELGGPLHSKGVLILSGYLGAKFARHQPLALSASLVFEQSYGGVDGDSASSTELYALLSALSGIPIRQSLAVTGSVDQHGQVQAIGGANEKIEGFFDICKARGLSGEQGVLIPESNVKHLMLRSDVVDAAKSGKFHVYPVSTIEQGIELLTGVAAGDEKDGHYADGTIFRLVQANLAKFAESAKAFAGGTTTEGRR